jgi:hypothetical protein
LGRLEKGIKLKRLKFGSKFVRKNFRGQFLTHQAWFGALLLAVQLPSP